MEFSCASTYFRHRNRLEQRHGAVACQRDRNVIWNVRLQSNNVVLKVLDHLPFQCTRFTTRQNCQFVNLCITCTQMARQIGCGCTCVCRATASKRAALRPSGFGPSTHPALSPPSLPPFTACCLMRAFFECSAPSSRSWAWTWTREPARLSLLRLLDELLFASGASRFDRVRGLKVSSSLVSDCCSFRKGG